MKILAWCVFIITSMAVTPVSAEQVLVAVAANFVPPFRGVVLDFEKTTNYRIQVTVDPSGNFYFTFTTVPPSTYFFPQTSSGRNL